MNIIPTKTCPVCKGEGITIVEVRTVVSWQSSITRIDTCARCFGRGVVMIDTVEGAP